MVRLKTMNISNIIWIEQVIFRDTYVYTITYTHMSITEVISLEEGGGDFFFEEFKGKKVREENVIKL